MEKEMQKAQKNKVVVEKKQDETVADLEGVAKALAQLHGGRGSACKRQAVRLVKMAVFKIENNKKRELTTEEASAFVKSGYTN